MQVFRDFHGNSKMPKAFSSSFLTLIPKNKLPSGLFQKTLFIIFYPSCLLLGHLISSNQYAFVPDKQLLDGVMVVNEVVNFATRTKNNYLLSKVDFEKA